MTCRGHVRNGVVVLSEPGLLPEGAEVEIMLRHERAAAAEGTGPSELPDAEHESIEDQIARIVADVPDSQWDRLPADLNEQLDHYIYGTPKR